MSGHSKWATIKRQKAINDAARGKIFSRLSKEITLAAQEGGDPQLNFALRLAIEKAKAANCPADNIERAVKKGTGELKDGAKIVEIIYEAYGPGNAAMLIKAQTDNTNRAVTEIRLVIEGKYNCKMAVAGSVAWQFNEKGIFVIKAEKFKESEKYGQEGHYEKVNGEELLLELMELKGVEDIQEHKLDTGELLIEITSAREDYADVAKQLSELKVRVEESGIGFKPTNPAKISEEEQAQLERLLESLDELDDVDQVWTNLAEEN